MSEKIIKYIKINGLQYNALRDPQAYRRLAGEHLRIQIAAGGASPVLNSAFNPLIQLFKPV